MFPESAAAEYANHVRFRVSGRQKNISRGTLQPVGKGA